MNRTERGKLEDDTYSAIWSTRGGVFFSRPGPGFGSRPEDADDIHYFCPLCNERIDLDVEPALYLEVLRIHLSDLSDDELQSHYIMAVMRDT